MKQTPKSIEAQRIVLNGPDGQPRIVMDACGESGPFVQVRSGGKCSIEMWGFPGDRGAALVIAGVKRHIVVRLEETGDSMIAMTDNNGMHSVQVIAPAGGTGVVRIVRDGNIIDAIGAQEPAG